MCASKCCKKVCFDSSYQVKLSGDLALLIPSKCCIKISLNIMSLGSTGLLGHQFLSVPLAGRLTLQCHWQKYQLAHPEAWVECSCQKRYCKEMFHFTHAFITQLVSNRHYHLTLVEVRRLLYCNSLSSSICLIYIHCRFLVVPPVGSYPGEQPLKCIHLKRYD